MGASLSSRLLKRALLPIDKLMLGLLEYERTPVAEASLISAEPSLSDNPQGSTASQTDYEIVLGRPQIASWMFVGVIALGVISAAAFYAGKNSATKPLTASPEPAAPAPVSPALIPLPEATILELPPDAVWRPGITDAPLIAQPEMGKLYLQIGAVNKGMAVILVEGLRNHGFRSFVAPGPNVNIFRVLIGPLPDQAAYRRAKTAANAIDLGTFARRFEVTASPAVRAIPAPAEIETQSGVEPAADPLSIATPTPLPPSAHKE